MSGPFGEHLSDGDLAESKSTLVPALVGDRFAGFMIDALIVGGVQWLVFLVAARQLQSLGLTSVDSCGPEVTLTCEGPSPIVWVILITWLVATTVGYHAWFDGRMGQTIGKRIVGTATVDPDDQRPIGLGRGLVRAVVRQSPVLALYLFFLLALPGLVVVLIPGLLVVGWALAALTRESRALHDLVAGSMVVSASQMVPPLAGDRARRPTTPDAGDDELALAVGAEAGE